MEAVCHHLRKFYNQRIDCIYIDLPLGNPYTSRICEI